ncbi:MAG TPA: N-acetylmuramoyl-L-alanine amidase [bacterium]|nr:N-acetylmuramoyl-L-alanine amidase [bacterium]HQO34601.1 N-acetylmuramoyl-L-alanine amidase [bacterium]HQP98407.1 N-acetylmuramoyl-L-alanine amidase [bacterium]
MMPNSIHRNTFLWFLVVPVLLLSSGRIGAVQRWDSLTGPKPIAESLPPDYVPATELCEALDSSWNWDPLSGRFEIVLPGDAKLVLLVDSSVAILGSQVFRLSQPVRFLQNRLAIPRSIIVEVLEPILGYSIHLPTPQPEPTPLLSQPLPTPAIDFEPEVSPLAPWTSPRTEFDQSHQPVRSSSGRLVVVIDPGHGGQDMGSVGTGTTSEAEVVLMVAKFCEEMVQNAFEIDVSLTRREHTDVPIVDRVTFANSSEACAFISLHAGGLFDPAMSLPSVLYQAPPSGEAPSLDSRSPDPSALRSRFVPWQSGSALWFPQSRDLAVTLHGVLKTAYADLPGVGTVSFEEGPRSGRLAILSGLLMPGVVVELGSLTNVEHEQILHSEGFQSGIAEVLSLAIGNWVYRQEGRPIRESLVP